MMIIEQGTGSLRVGDANGSFVRPVLDLEYCCRPEVCQSRNPRIFHSFDGTTMAD